MKLAMMASLFLASNAFAHVHHELEHFETKPVMADLRDLEALNIPVVAADREIEVGVAIVTPDQLAKIQDRSHKVGKCGGFEDLSQERMLMGSEGYKSLLKDLSNHKQMNDLYDRAPFRLMSLQPSEEITQAIAQVSEENLRSDVAWLSAFPSRSNKDPQPNIHVDQLKLRLEALLAGTSLPYEVAIINHSSTKQNSLRVRLVGKTQPQEIIVLGGHLDSINGSWFGGKSAPGADDNASGSANLIEALRVLLSQGQQTARTIEFFWYAGEESGLLGSGEIAKQYKSESKDVVAVLQLDMTLFPGSGELVIGSMTDFTSAWLRDYLKSINSTYLNARILEDRCGYGCSDHASWHRQGYPTLMPFEATFRATNKDIHTSRDVITPDSNFKHSALFTKIAVIMAMDLGNNSERQPY